MQITDDLGTKARRALSSIEDEINSIVIYTIALEIKRKLLDKGLDETYINSIITDVVSMIEGKICINNDNNKVGYYITNGNITITKLSHIKQVLSWCTDIAKKYSESIL